MKALSFSRRFPVYHPRAGSKTYFVEKLLNHWGIDWTSVEYKHLLFDLNKRLPVTEDQLLQFYYALEPHEPRLKTTTIRSHKRPLKPGEVVSPYIWSGVPYNSKKIIFAPPVAVQRNDTIIIDCKSTPAEFFRACIDVEKFSWERVNEMAINDGLQIEDFLAWFRFNRMKYTAGVITP